MKPRRIEPVCWSTEYEARLPARGLAVRGALVGEPSMEPRASLLEGVHPHAEHHQGIATQDARDGASVRSVVPVSPDDDIGSELASCPGYHRMGRHAVTPRQPHRPVQQVALSAAPVGGRAIPGWRLLFPTRPGRGSGARKRLAQPCSVPSVSGGANPYPIIEPKGTLNES
jgi:hypothetical protein